MKKQLLAVTLLLSAGVTHTAAALLAASQGPSIPDVTHVGAKHTVTKHKGKKLKTSNGNVSIKSTDKGHEFTGKRPGKTDILNDKGKVVDTVVVAYPNLQSVPATLVVGKPVYVENDGVDVKQANSGEKAGHVNITNSKKIHGHTYKKINPKDSGKIVLEDENGNQVKTFTAIEPSN